MGKRNRSGKRNKPLTTKLAGNEVMQGSSVSNIQPSSAAIKAELCSEGVGVDNGLPLRSCGGQRRHHDEVQHIPAPPSEGDQSSVAEQCLSGGK